MDEESLIELNQAIVDCFYVAQIIIDELPDIPKIELLEEVINLALTYTCCQVCVDPELIKMLRKSIKEFRETVEIGDYDKEEFIKSTIERCLDVRWK